MPHTMISFQEVPIKTIFITTPSTLFTTSKAWYAFYLFRDIFPPCSFGGSIINSWSLFRKLLKAMHLNELFQIQASSNYYFKK